MNFKKIAEETYREIIDHKWEGQTAEVYRVEVYGVIEQSLRQAWIEGARRILLEINSKLDFKNVIIKVNPEILLEEEK